MNLVLKFQTEIFAQLGSILRRQKLSLVTYDLLFGGAVV